MPQENEEDLVFRTTPDRLWGAGVTLALLGFGGIAGLFMLGNATAEGLLLVLFVVGVAGGLLVSNSPIVTAHFDRRQCLLTWKARSFGRYRDEQVVPFERLQRIGIERHFYGYVLVARTDEGLALPLLADFRWQAAPFAREAERLTAWLGDEAPVRVETVPHTPAEQKKVPVGELVVLAGFAGLLYWVLQQAW